VLRDWANNDTGTGRSWLHLFLEFCTGQSYLPDPSQEFMIKVMFEDRSHEKDSTHKDRLPVSYMCANQLCLPLQAYYGNREKFEEKLEYSVEHSDHFSMH
jgi:hypothetical protein